MLLGSALLPKRSLFIL